jgi:hypothetical protein
MWIIQEPKKVALWNKRHFEDKNGECAARLKYSVLIFVEKNIKCNIWRVAVRPSYIKDSGFLKVKKQLKHFWILLQPQFDTWLQYLNQAKSSAHHMYHLPYSYIYNQSKIKLLILTSFQTSTWCSWELHSLRILSFITECLLPKILRPCSGLVFKVLWSNRPLTFDDEVTAVSKHWATNAWWQGSISQKERVVKITNTDALFKN